MNYKTIATILSVNLLIGSTAFTMPPLEGNWEPDYPPRREFTGSRFRSAR